MRESINSSAQSEQHHIIAAVNMGESIIEKDLTAHNLENESWINK